MTTGVYMADYTDPVPDIPDAECIRVTACADAMLAGQPIETFASETCAAAFGLLVRLGLMPVKPYPGPLAGGIEPRRMATKKIPKPKED